MCCKKRQCPANTVGLLSVIMLLVAIGMTLLSVKFLELSTFTEFLHRDLRKAYMLMFAGCGVSVVTGLFGIVIFSVKRVIWCNIVFSLFVLVSGILLLINGLHLTALLRHKDLPGYFCEKSLKGTGSSMFTIGVISNSLNRIQENTFDLATMNMCTD